MPSPEKVAMLEGFRAAKEVWAARRAPRACPLR